MFKEYALVTNNAVTHVINFNPESNENLEDVLSRFSYDEVIDCSLYKGVYFYTGKEKVKDKFRDPQPFPSWSYDYESNTWVPPAPYPGWPTNPYVWDEETQQWKKCDCDVV